MRERNVKSRAVESMKMWAWRECAARQLGAAGAWEARRRSRVRTRRLLASGFEVGRRYRKRRGIASPIGVSFGRIAEGD